MGSYEALDGGLTFEALQDFTGGCTEIFMFKDIEKNFGADEDAVFRQMQMSYKHSDFMGTSVKVSKLN